VLVVAFVLGTGCEANTSEQAKEALDEAARKAEKGVEQAKQGTREAAEEAARKAEQAARKAEQGVEQGVEQAKAGLADARDRLEIEARIEKAKESLDEGMNDAAVAFEEVAESGKAQAGQISEKIEKAGTGIELEPNAINCDERPEARICRIDPALIAQLAEEPRLLAREISLRPKKGTTGRGLELWRARAEGFTGRLGLREGDIILEINGAELSSFEAIKALDKALSGKPEAKVIYERDGKREELTVVQQVP
jgi:hypothetical protein